ncbi:spore coat protein U domain-containing protein, partial [Vibrio vulnificus]|uniref:spore coat protein U domain-containing protein n=1 Tax=Vibrio vulnificus TaxID=672 RepID=UPI0039B690E8
NFAALGFNVACNRSGADSRRTEDLAVTVQISAGASGNAAARALATPIAGVNQYNYYTDAAYSNPYGTVNIGTMSWGGNFLFGDTSTQQ